MDELLLQDQKNNPEKYLPKPQENTEEKENKKAKEPPKEEIVQAVGIIIDIRKNITKT